MEALQFFYYCFFKQFINFFFLTYNFLMIDPMQNPLESPSHWPLEFERQQREIIDLWNACNVSLVHRTYFFLLFKGDRSIILGVGPRLYSHLEH